MFERFTKEAKGVVLEAIAQAEQRDDRRVSTEHLLLGAAVVSPALDFETIEEELHRLDAVALQMVGIDPALARLVPRRSRNDKKRHLPFTSEAKKVLTNSLREALVSGDRDIDVTHILLALTRLGAGDRAIRAMSASGVDPTELRESLRGRRVS